MDTTTAAAYRERLYAPLSWWVAGAGVSLLMGWVMRVASTFGLGVAMGVVTAVVLGIPIWMYGSVVVTAGPEELRVGRAHIDAEFLGAPQVIGTARWRDVIGRDFNVSGYLVSRPWLNGGVRVPVIDPSDPAPYWVIGSRNPEALAAAIGHTGDVQATKGTHGGEA